MINQDEKKTSRPDGSWSSRLSFGVRSDYTYTLPEVKVTFSLTS